MTIKVAEPGAPLKWIEDHVRFDGDECLPWPFARHKHGDGKGRAKMFGFIPDRLMCTLAKGPAPTPKHQVAHSCGNGHNACLNRNHLRWATNTENQEDARDHGTMCRGERSPQAKLTESDIREIRHLAKTKTRTSIAVIYGVSTNQICQIVRRIQWRHVQ